MVKGLFKTLHCFEDLSFWLFIKVSKGKEEKAFYSIPEYEEWKNSVGNVKSWKVKYYKGLGTSTPKEAKEYFADMNRHQIQFHHDGPSCDEAILMVNYFNHASLVLKRGVFLSAPD